ncbi:MAG: hypothetical protein Q8L48_19855 [Archangium sp.]|nr:hypothetical protein [Archangium sp.]
MSKSQNQRYLWWTIFSAGLRAPTPTVLALVVVLVALSLFFGVRSAGQTSAQSTVLGGWTTPLVLWMTLTGLLLTFRRWRGNRFRARYRDGLQSPDSSTVIAVIDQNFAVARGRKDVDASLALDRGLARLIYGELDGAKRELNAVRWEQRAPLVQGYGASLASYICLFGTGELEAGLAAARRAQELTQLGSWPGAASWRAYFETGVVLAEVLNGHASAGALTRLEQTAATTQHPVQRLFTLYGLSVAARRAGDAAKAREFQQTIQREAPHCRALIIPD